MGYHDRNLHDKLINEEAKEVLEAVLDGQLSAVTARTWLKLNEIDYSDLPEMLQLED